VAEAFSASRELHHTHDDDSTTSTEPSGGGGGGGGSGGMSTASVVPETLINMYSLSGHSGSSSMVQSAVEFQALGAFEQSDLTTFISNTGVASFSVVKDIGPFDPTSPQAESTLDVQYLGAIGAGNTNWYWTEADWIYEWQTAVLAGTQALPDVFSVSYGWSEVDQCTISPTSAPCSQGGSQNFVTVCNTNFQKIGALGVTVMVAAGDAGAHGRTDENCASDQVHPDWPTSSPYITAVGATQLATSTVGGTSPICKGQLSCAVNGTEIVCSKASGALITSGGGFSAYAPQPSYQTSVVQGYLSQSGLTPPSSDFNPSGRGYPDVSALGHNYYIELTGQVQAVDGTSAACPVFAGVMALLNAYRVSNGMSKMGFANPLLYSIWASTPSAFTDITIGNNKCTEESCCATGFSATTGWDAVSGMGTPVLPNLISGMQALFPELRGKAVPVKVLDALKLFPAALRGKAGGH
jgi:tripeptidyl-peptidase-1